MEYKTIRQETEERCIEEQLAAKDAAFAAQWLLQNGFTITTKRAQELAAQHADEARMRLFSLLGTRAHHLYT